VRKCPQQTAAAPTLAFSERYPCGRAHKIPGGYVARDANRQAIAYIYSRDNEVEARKAKTLIG
jgi:hypothetical protein